MKVIKWGTVIAVTFAVAWVLLFTFTQEPFRGSAPVKVFWYTSPSEFPMYAYAAMAFGFGLAIGFFVAAYYYISGRAGIHSKKKEIRRLEDAVKQLSGELEQARNTIGQAHDKITRSQKAVGDKSTRSQKAVGEKDLLV